MSAARHDKTAWHEVGDRAGAALGLAQGFEQVLYDWAAQKGSTPQQAQAVAQAGRLVIQALQEGHVCITIDDSMRPALLATGLVATPVDRHGQPLVLDEHQRLYLHRDFDHEHALAQRIAAAVDTPTETPDDIEAAPGMPALSADQQAAVRVALTHRFSLISGGPGTGKTTTVVSLLHALLQRNTDLRIVLTAPTGKAAARLLESVLSAAHNWPEVLRSRLPSQASTLHRLLGRGAHKMSARHSSRPDPASLAADVLVVDEASMVDLALARDLLQAAAPNARLVLLGDKDQLSAVEAGAVFSELCASAPHLPGVAVLRQAFRFEAKSAIPQLATAVLQGTYEPVSQLLGSSAPGLRWIEPTSRTPLSPQSPEIQGVWTEGFAAYQRAVQACWEQQDDLGHQVSEALNALSRFRVLCAVREGPWGVQAWNRHLSEALGLSLDSSPSHRTQQFGQPIVIRHNDADLGLFNGDMGVLLPNSQGQPHAVFADHSPRSSGWRSIPTAQLPAHELAWAMTVHLAQGSEFEQVLLVLPSVRGHELSESVRWPGLTREWLYTAVTRAKRNLVVLSEREALQTAVQQHRPRASGLRDQLRQALNGHASNAPATAVAPRGVRR